MQSHLPADKIILEGMVFYGFHGAKQAEKELGQRFVVDVEIWTDVRHAARSDTLADTVNYSAIYRLVAGVVTGQSCNLIETLAERVAAAIIDQYPVDAVRVKVAKPNAPIAGVLGSVAVEILRRPAHAVSAEQQV